MLLDFVTKSYRSFFELILWMILLFCIAFGGLVGWLFGGLVGIPVGAVLGLVGGLLLDIMWGGFVSIILFIDLNIQSMAKDIKTLTERGGEAKSVLL